MSWYYYDDGREQKARLQRELQRRQKRGEKFEVVTAPPGNKLTRTFWAQAWCKHLENHSHYAHRLPRGRSYLRQGNVYNLAIEPGQVTAHVAGSSLYDVCITITPLAKSAWKCIKADCAGQVASLLDLLGGKLGDGVLRTVTDPERGLFPKSKEIRLSCTCPDYADMCKHVAAVLYGVGVQLDAQPDLFFRLRSVDPSELLSSAVQESLTPSEKTDAALTGEDLSALFGIEIGEMEPAVPAPVAKVKKPRADAVVKEQTASRSTKKKAPQKAGTKRKPAPHTGSR